MKKIISVLLVLCMVFAALPVFADEAKLSEEVLLTVKSRIDVPEELDEFQYSQSTYDNVLRYDFTWHNEDYTKEMYITSDALGRIVGYNYYEQIDYSEDRSLIGYTLSDAQPLAEEFVKKAYPEYFENEDDILKLNDEYTASNYSGRYKSFSFRFERFYKGEAVASNWVQVRVRATKEKIYVQSVTAALDEDATFADVNTTAIGENEYTDRFPIKLYYATDYSDKDSKVALFYSVDKGYVSRVDGEIVTEKRFDRYAEYGAEEDAVMESMSTADGSVNRNNKLTEAEVKALEEMASLVPVSQIEAKLREIEILHITDDMKLDSTNANKYDKEYVVRFTLRGDKQTTNVTYNGETGEVTRVYSYLTNYTEKPYDPQSKASDSASVMPASTVENLAKILAGDKINETEVEYKENTMIATRSVNGITYPENSIRATYNAEHNMVTSYTLNWDKDVTSFPKPQEVIGLDKATDVIFGIAPIYNTLVKTEDGYIPSATIKEAVTINAITGKEQYSTDDGKKAYDDIDSHWAKNEITALWEHDIYIPNGKFNPDGAINQADMLLLFSACRDSGVIPIGWEKVRIAEYGVTNGYVEASEPDKLITRKEAFETLVNILGYGDIASYDIYKSSYTDMEADGSAEILKAMGILKGDTARGNDYLTYAEAAVMVYRYLSK